MTAGRPRSTLPHAGVRVAAIVDARAVVPPALLRAAQQRSTRSSYAVPRSWMLTDGAALSALRFAIGAGALSEFASTRLRYRAAGTRTWR